MAITVVQTAGPTSDTGTPATISQAFASNVTAGNTVIALVYGANWPAASTDNITASDGTSYTQAIKSGALTDDKTLCAIFYRDNHPGGACTVTATPSSAAQRMQIVLIEVSGLDTTNSLEDTTTASGTGTAVDAGNLVTAGDAILIQMSVANSGYTSISAGTNFVSVGFTVTWTGVIGERRIVTGAGTYATPSTINTSSQWQAIGAAFKAGAGGGGSSTGAPTHRALLGMF